MIAVMVFMVENRPGNHKAHGDLHDYMIKVVVIVCTCRARFDVLVILSLILGHDEHPICSGVQCLLCGNLDAETLATAIPRPCNMR